MKILFYACLLVCFGSSLYGQRKNSLFVTPKNAQKISNELSLIGESSVLKLNQDYWEDLLDNHKDFLQVTIPYGETELKLSLYKTELYKNDLNVRTASGKTIQVNKDSKSVFYHGAFEGHPNSHFALSILNSEVIGIGSILGIGDVNLGKIKDREEYIFFSEEAIDGHNSFECGTTGEPEPKPEGIPFRGPVDDCVGLYFEVDYEIFLDRGGVMKSVDYMTALFNEIQYLFELDGMTVYISDMLVWDEESPYSGITDTGTLLDLFGTTTTVWEGDLGHYVNTGLGGGLAWLNVLCSPNQALRKAVSGINLSFAEVPFYSWDVEVISHELGHNLGSPHTHACFWNGDMTAIDGCGEEAGFGEGCEGPIPNDEGGTVMSYCHLVGAGINLGNGFGMQPGDLLRDNILEAECLMSCDLTVMNVDITGASISETCENGPIQRKISIKNNGNDNLTFFDIQVFINGVFVETIEWTGFVPEGGTTTISLPETSLPLGSYTMQLIIESPDGYEDEDPSDNTHTYSFDVTPYPVASFVAEPDELISYNAITRMINTSTGASSYLWDFKDGSLGTT